MVNTSGCALFLFEMGTGQKIATSVPTTHSEMGTVQGNKPLSAHGSL